ncbi:MAG: hypothetical protein A2096_09380 [Spirochaetes bacterium GWF1_41_5]|nr:MAG: hypothetical protein A2096_09380 [Spirochaetes bacterium GWF1_41_5]HBE01713.1 hypothetical protein [Spirochaetia bacterium]
MKKLLPLISIILLISSLQAQKTSFCLWPSLNLGINHSKIISSAYMLEGNFNLSKSNVVFLSLTPSLTIAPVKYLSLMGELRLQTVGVWPLEIRPRANATLQFKTRYIGISDRNRMEFRFTPKAYNLSLRYRNYLKFDLLTAANHGVIPYIGHEIFVDRNKSGKMGAWFHQSWLGVNLAKLNIMAAVEMDIKHSTTATFVDALQIFAMYTFKINASKKS